MAINETHDPKLKSWVESANDPGTDFPVQSLPFCMYNEPGHDWDGARLGIAIGDQVVDFVQLLVQAERAGMTAELIACGVRDAMAVDLLTLSPAQRVSLRMALSRAVRSDAGHVRAAMGDGMRSRRDLVITSMFEPGSAVPTQATPIGNYTDFYASIHHATTVGSMFRPDNPLLPNYKHVPIGYHGRASSIVVSGADVKRPQGQIPPPDDKPQQGPTFGPSRMLDYELEVGALIGPGNAQGEPIPIADAEEHVFGLCLVNDWSARDIQKWEYQPLGPFLAKNFATTISPYVVTLEALEPFRCPAYKRPEGDPAPLEYLRNAENERRGGFDITLEVWLRSAEMERRGMSPVRLSKSNAFKDLYWTFGQMVAHHTSNGCNLQPGDLLASGTVSGVEPGTRGCLLESTWQGRGPDGKPLPRKPIDLPSGEKRTFLEDGDEVIFKGYCEREGFRRIGFGECRGRVKGS